MSKSDPLERSRILITDTKDEICAKIAASKTDSIKGISYDPKNRPGISNLLEMLSIFDGEKRSPVQLAEECAETHPRVFKDMVSDAIIAGLDGVRARYLDMLEGNDARLESIEQQGGRKAQQSAEETMRVVRNAIGL